MTKHSTSDHNDPIEILREEARAAAQCHGVERCDELAESLISRFCYRLGGAHIYIARINSVERKKSISEMRLKFNGNNARELAKEFGFSIRHTRRLLQG